MKTSKNTANSERSVWVGVELTARAAGRLRGVIATEHDMRDRLTDMVAHHGSQKAVADILGVSKGYLSDVLMGRRPVSSQMAERMGWKRVTVFVGRG
ncbi:MAG: helix-turn-helix transcriptional regulator [Dehalococcoidia bacterium]